MGEVFKLNHCYNVDCLPAMELFPDNYFDLAVVDPPYFSGPERRGFYGSKVSKIGVHRDYPVSPAWSKPEPEYFRELFRVCRHYIVWGCNYFDYQFATGRIVWDKCNGNSSFSDCEIAATNLFSSVRMFRYMWSGMMQGKSITEGDTMQGNKSLNEKRIPQRIEIIRRQCTALSDEVDPMRGMGTDGMPRGGTPGDSTAAMACRMDELGIGDQLRQLERQRAVLLEDQNIIRGQMNRLDSGHNLILTEFYISHKKWHEVQQKVPYSVQHLKYLRNVALAQLGRNLERLPECAALLSRALNTREGQRRADAWAEGDILL